MTSSQKEIYQHYHVNDREFIDKAFEWLMRIEEKNVFFLTPFLNPHQGKILRQLAQSRGVVIYSSDQFYSSEEARHILAPDYYILDKDDFEMDLLQIDYAQKFHTLKHSQIMGSLIHQLGIQRWTFGDIIRSGQDFQIMVDRRFTSIFQDQLKKIGPVSVDLKLVSFDHLLSADQDWQQKEVLLSSMRLDKVIGQTFNLSRAKASDIVKAGLVKVNYNIEETSSRILELGDRISVRRFGRIHLKESQGLSKNGKYKITVELVRSK